MQYTFDMMTADGLKLHGRYWPAKEAKAVVALVHGMGEHIQRYEHMAAYFNAHGVSIMGFDQRGHGRSAGQRGHAPSLDVLLDSVGGLLAQAAQLGLPIFLYGHSMGGNLVLNHLLRRHPKVAGVIASAPWVQLAFRPPALLLMIAKGLRRLLPTFSQPTGLDAAALSHVEAVVAAYKADPLVHGQITTAMSMALLDGGDWLDQHAGPVSAPLLIMHGDADSITSAPASQALAKRLTGDVTMKLWPGMFHEIHNEEAQKEVFDVALAWIGERMRG